jgi:hypothetical protein
MTILNLHIDRYLQRLLVILILISGCSGSVFAAKDSLIVPLNDSSTVELREPDANVQQKVFSDEDWKYVEEKSTDQKDSFFDRLLDKLLRSLFEDVTDDLDSAGNKSRRMNGWTIFILLIGVALIVFFVLKATGTGGNLLFKRKTKAKEDVDASVEDVDIHAINYDSQIQSALLANDYRLAVRLWFLRSLKEMTDRDLINWKIDKTNSDYYYELSDTGLQQQFGRVSLIYDYIWYGDFEVDEMRYRKVEDDLRSFHSAVLKKEVKK